MNHPSFSTQPSPRPLTTAAQPTLDATTKTPFRCYSVPMQYQLSSNPINGWFGGRIASWPSAWSRASRLRRRKQRSRRQKPKNKQIFYNSLRSEVKPSLASANCSLVAPLVTSEDVTISIASSQCYFETPQQLKWNHAIEGFHI